jgi:hypothetical protein
MRGHIVSAQANFREAKVKARRAGRSQNYMPSEAAHAIEQAQKAQQTVVRP